MRRFTVGAALSLLLSLTQGPAHGQALAQAPAAQSPAPSASGQAHVTRQRIDREREALNAALLLEQQACRQGLWVNACLDEAQARYRQALKPLQQQQQVLEQARRQRMGEQARQRVQDKQEAQEQRKAQADGSSSESAEPALTQSSQAARLAQARERALKQQQREAAAEQRRRDRAGAVPPAPDAAQAEKPVR